MDGNANRDVKTSNPFDNEHICAMIDSEVLRQADLLFQGAFAEISLSRSRTLSAKKSVTDLVNAAVFDDIWGESHVSEPGITFDTSPSVRAWSPSTADRPSSLSRSRTDTKIQNPPAFRTYLSRAASARAGTQPAHIPGPFDSPRSREASETPSRPPSRPPSLPPIRPASRPPTRPPTRPNLTLGAANTTTSATSSPRSLSSRVAAIVSRTSSRAASAVAASEAAYLCAPLSKGSINQLTPRSRGHSIDVPDIVINDDPLDMTDEEYLAKREEIVALVKRKFKKHVIYKPVDVTNSKRKCMCSDNCAEIADVYADRYGRVGNKLHIKPGFYAIEHLVEIFIDAYDAEKALEDEEDRQT